MFYYGCTVEIFVSIFSGLPHLMEPKDIYEKWSSVINWFFIVTEVHYVLLIIILLYYPGAVERMTE
jgi:hypothetical protein